MLNRKCDEEREWMMEKMKKMDKDEIGNDIKKVKDIKRRNEKIESEMEKVEEKVNRVKMLEKYVK